MSNPDPERYATIRVDVDIDTTVKRRGPSTYVDFASTVVLAWCRRCGAFIADTDVHDKRCV